MALAACKVPINCRAMSATGACQNAMQGFETIMLSPEWNDLPLRLREAYVKKAIEIDEALIIACEDHRRDYEDLFRDMEEAIDENRR